jgi:hypothetical protein
LLAGQFVEEGKLRWDSTLAEVLPELKDNMDAEFAKIQRCLDELVIKGSAGLTALTKTCLLLGRDSGFIGSR